METKELQELSVRMVDTLDEKFNVNRDAQLSFAQMLEEIGELGRDINLPRLRHREPDRENLEGEFADVFMQLSKLAGMMDLDLERAVLKKMATLKKRHGLE